jgi:hypothetical protein
MLMKVDGFARTQVWLEAQGDPVVVARRAAARLRWFGVVRPVGWNDRRWYRCAGFAQACWGETMFGGAE